MSRMRRGEGDEMAIKGLEIDSKIEENIADGKRRQKKHESVRRILKAWERVVDGKGRVGERKKMQG